MPLQDLTPQLRTRLNKVERAVGWFVFLATALLLFGFGYYLYHTAERKGWFLVKAKFYTYVNNAAGLNVGDEVAVLIFMDFLSPGRSWTFGYLVGVTTTWDFRRSTVLSKAR